MILRNDYPILEYSTQRQALINLKEHPEARFPRLCLMAFFEEVLVEAARKYQGARIGAYRSEMKDFPVYRINCKRGRGLHGSSGRCFRFSRYDGRLAIRPGR